MTIQYSPNGVSFAQLKKDAKKIKKEQSITHLEALDIATKNKTKFSSWEKLEEYVKKQNGTLIKMNIFDSQQVLYKKNNLISIVLRPGGGKTLGMLKILQDNANKFKKVGFLNHELSLTYIHDYFKPIIEQNEDLEINIYDSFNNIEDDIDLLIIDSYEFADRELDFDLYTKLQEFDIPVLIAAQAMRMGYANSIENIREELSMNRKSSPLKKESGVIIYDKPLTNDILVNRLLNPLFDVEFKNRVIIENKHNK